MATIAVLLLASGHARSAEGSTLVVTKAEDTDDGVCDNDCSLREAITSANAAPGADVINFDIPGPGPHTIRPGGELPVITDPVTIDGYSQPSASANTNPPTLGTNARIMVEIDGGWTDSPPVSLYWGLKVGSGGSSIKGLAVNDVYRIGIWLDGAGGNHIEGNFIGTDASGAADQGNGDDGVYVSDSPGNVIGGEEPAARNVISGNNRGVVLILNGSTGNLVAGNLIGLDATGTASIPNIVGITVGEASGNTIGGLTPGARNVISGNQEAVWINGGNGNAVLGNYIGASPAGAEAIENTGTGVAIRFGSENIVGGPAAGAGNVISGNHVGVSIGETSSTGNLVQGNLIGTDAAGTRAIGNSSEGVQIVASGNIVGGSKPGEGNVIAANYYGIYLGPGNYANVPSANVIQGNFIGTDKSGELALGNLTYGIELSTASSNVIGGAIAGAGNVIAWNGNGGIRVDPVSIGNAIRGNSIFSNDDVWGLGIDLATGSNGVTPNDPGDADEGPNRLQNFPELTVVSVGSSDLSISGTLNSQPETSYFLDFYSSPVCHGSGFGEGKTILGTALVDTDANGDAEFTAGFVGVPKEFSVAATATDPNGNTSEFSRCLTPRLSGDVDCSNAVDSVDALKILRSVAGLTVGLPSRCTFDGDVDCGGDVDAVDALFVLRFVAGLDDELAACDSRVSSPASTVWPSGVARKSKTSWVTVVRPR